MPTLSKTFLLDATSLLNQHFPLISISISTQKARFAREVVRAFFGYKSLFCNVKPQRSQQHGGHAISRKNSTSRFHKQLIHMNLILALRNADKAMNCFW
jgi:hypothetical protein